MTFSELSKSSCLVLLGEPGIGKSRALEKALAEDRSAHGAATFLHRELGSYGSEERLIEEIFKSPEMVQWSGGTGELYLFLDSFDECLLRLDTVAALIKDQIGRLSRTDGLHLRITSRTAEWRTSLEQAFSKRWSAPGQVTVVELAPLTEAQVRVAVEMHSIDADAFVAEVIRKDVAAFAIKPVTLEMLIRVWKKNGGSLPPTRLEIYELGCLELCSETNPDRQTPLLAPKLTPEQRLATAGHIAAGMLFCRRASIWRGQRPSEKEETDIADPELLFGSVTIEGVDFPITKEALQETLNSGLFTARGKDRLGWAHQTYAEFLAARWVRQQKLGLKQIYDLLIHPFDPEHRVIPQLQEVASWIAVDKTEFFERLLSVEPELLLRSDIGRIDTAIKQALVTALLAAFAIPNRTIDRSGVNKMYAKLAYPGLLEQLRAALVQYRGNAAPQVEAIRIAQACELTGLGTDLVATALDQNENMHARITSATFIANTGSDSDRKSLLPLALGQFGTCDDLKASALKACWPKHLSATQLFTSLAPEQPRMVSTYSLFLMNDLVKGLSVSDLPVALDWVAEQPGPPFPVFGRIRGVATDILVYALKDVDRPETLDALAKTILVRMRKHDFQMSHEMKPLVEAINDRPSLRLKIVEAMLPHVDDPKEDTVFLCHLGFPWVQRVDLDWLLNRLREAQLPHARQVLARLVMGVFYPVDAETAEKVLQAVENSAELKETLAIWIEAVDIRSQEAIRAREAFERNQEYQAEMAARQQPELLSPSPQERMKALLDQSSNGDLSGWWKACTWLSVDEYGLEQNLHSINYCETRGWKAAPPEIRAQIIWAAREYLLGAGPAEDTWMNKRDVLHLPAIAGVIALLLLAEEAPADYEALDQEVWRRWCPAIVGLRTFGDRELFQRLIGDALTHVSEITLDWIMRTIAVENEHDGHLEIIWKLPDPLPPLVGQKLVAEFGGLALGAPCRKELLSFLVEKGAPGSIALLRSLLPSQPPEDGEELKLVLEVARLLMLKGESNDWKRIWAMIQDNIEFGKALVEGFHGQIDIHPDPVLRALTESEVAEFWKWLQAQYPFSTDPPQSENGFVETRWSMGRFRDGLINYLINLGTMAAVENLQALATAYQTQVPWLPGVIATAMDGFRRKTWNAPTPRIVFQLARNAHARFVESGDQLQEVVLDALAQIQLELSGEVPASPDLWNKDRPKEEEAFSDWLKRHLDTQLKGRGIILNREVKIHAKFYTDIHVDAVSSDAASVQILKVIIEVKGCWHPGLKTAMQTQLLDTYLKNNDCGHGIYAVGWFICEAWSKRDTRRKQVPFSTSADLRAFLDSQAGTLSSPVKKLKACVLEALMPTPSVRKKKPKRKRA